MICAPQMQTEIAYASDGRNAVWRIPFPFCRSSDIGVKVVDSEGLETVLTEESGYAVVGGFVYTYVPKGKTLKIWLKTSPEEALQFTPPPLGPTYRPCPPRPPAGGHAPCPPHPPAGGPALCPPPVIPGAPFPMGMPAFPASPCGGPPQPMDPAAWFFFAVGEIKRIQGETTEMIRKAVDEAVARIRTGKTTIVLDAPLAAGVNIAVPEHSLGDNSLYVFVDGVLCSPGSALQYVETSGATISFNNSLPAGSVIVACCFSAE